MVDVLSSPEVGSVRPAWQWRRLVSSPAPIILALGILAAAMLALPGKTITTRALEELMLALDGLYRVLSGQVPNSDFHSALGPLTYYLPAIGYRLSGSYGGAMPTALSLFLLAAAAISAHVLASRLRAALAVPFAIFLFLVLAVPMNLGDGVTSLSFAMFYNRVGWVAIAILLVMYLRPTNPHRAQTVLDVLCASALTLVMIYTKITYGLVALVFLLFMLTDRRQRGWTALTLAITVGLFVLVELFWKSSVSYAEDIITAANASGGILRGNFGQILDHLLANFADYVLLALLVGIALWRRWSLRDLVFVLLCAIGGFWLINQNDQRWGILAIHAAAAVVAERLLRDFDAGGQPEGPLVNRAGVQLYFFAFVLPTIVHCAIALTLHTVVATASSGRPLPIAGMESIELADLWTPGDFGAGSWYAGTVAEGISALRQVSPAPERVFTLPGPNPFSAAMAIRPASGDAIDMRWNATLNAVYHVPPQQMLAGVDIVLERLGGGGAWEVGQLYLPFVRANFHQIAQTQNWRIFRRNSATLGEVVRPSSSLALSEQPRG